MGLLTLHGSFRHPDNLIVTLYIGDETGPIALIPVAQTTHTLVVELPDEGCTLAGTFRLMVGTEAVERPHRRGRRKKGRPVQFFTVLDLTLGYQGSEGPEGLQGPQGDKGDPGEPGISGYEQVVESRPWMPVNDQSLMVNCPAGKKVLGGGGSSDDTRVIVASSYPVDDTTWEVRFHTMLLIPPVFDPLQAFAICANVSP